MATIFNGQRNGECLDQFCERSIRPPEPELESFGSKIDGLVRFLHEQFPSQPSLEMVLKSGSLGKGTAIRQKVDIDLVCYVNGIASVHQLIAVRPSLLEQLKRKVLSYGPWRGSLKYERDTPYSIQFTLNGNGVDMLLAFNTLKIFKTPKQIYAEMEKDIVRFEGNVNKVGQEYSASLTELQIDFVKHKPGYVKDVIRLIKQLKTDKKLRIRSYTIELLTIKAWEYLGEKPVGTPVIFREVMTMLCSYKSLSVSFNTNYNGSDYVRYHHKPYVMDPANPFKNTLSGITESMLHNILVVARETLKFV